MTNACTWSKLEHSECPCVHNKGFTLPENNGEKYAFDQESVQSVHSGLNKKPVWLTKFHLSAAGYNVFVHVIVSGAKWVSGGMECLRAKPNTVISKGEPIKWR